MGWNNNRNYYGYRKYNKSAARLSNLVCGLLFITFSMVYLAVFQKDLLEAIHFSMAKGNTEFHILPAAIIVTVILIILEWGLNLLMRLRGSVKALAYLPSFLGLVTMTGFGRDVYTGGFSHAWWWLMPLLTAVYVLIVVMVRKNVRPNWEEDTLNMTIWNIVLMLAMSISTMCLGNTDRYFHNELRMESMMAKGNNGEALRVAAKSARTTRTMTALRMLAMTKEGKTGEMLFRYPQNYRAGGMFFDSDSSKTLRFTNDSIYACLGEKPYYGENKMEYLKRLAQKGDSCMTARTYYLAGLMLEKRMDEFSQSLEKFAWKGDTLQRYYIEAALMYKEINPEWKYEIPAKDSVYHKKLVEYRNRQNDPYKSVTEERNKMKLEFGDTFWWYYDYQ